MVTRKQHRILVYKQSGFLPFEISVLKNLPLNIPYIRMLRKKRKIEYDNAKENGGSKSAYISSIMIDYERYQWRNKQGNSDVWSMIQFWENKWVEFAKRNPDNKYWQSRLTKVSQKQQLGKRLIKGNIKSQKARYRETHKLQISEYRKKYRLRHKLQ